MGRGVAWLGTKTSPPTSHLPSTDAFQVVCGISNILATNPDVPKFSKGTMIRPPARSFGLPNGFRCLFRARNRTGVEIGARSDRRSAGIRPSAPTRRKAGALLRVVFDVLDVLSSPTNRAQRAALCLVFPWQVNSRTLESSSAFFFGGTGETGGLCVSSSRHALLSVSRRRCLSGAESLLHGVRLLPEGRRSRLGTRERSKGLWVF